MIFQFINVTHLRFLACSAILCKHILLSLRYGITSFSLFHARFFHRVFCLTQTPQTFAEAYIAIARMCLRYVSTRQADKRERSDSQVCEFCVVCVRPREHSAKPTHASATMRVLCKWSLCETQIIRLKHIHRICILRFSRDLCLLQVRNGEEGESLKEHYPHRPKCFSSNSHS